MTATWSLFFEERSALVLRAPGGEKTPNLRLPVGLDALAATLRHDPPTPLEIEHAIEQVEDAVMPVRARLPADLALQSGDALLRDLARHAGGDVGGDPAWLDVDAVERLFNRLAARAQGRPASQDDLPTGASHAAVLIVLRELMHHWGLRGIALRG